jgi:hypothetical protein
MDFTQVAPPDDLSGVGPHLAGLHLGQRLTAGGLTPDHFETQITKTIRMTASPTMTMIPQPVSGSCPE